MTLKAKVVRSSVSTDLKTVYYKGVTGTQSASNTEGYKGVDPYNTNLGRDEVFIKLYAFKKTKDGLVEIFFNIFDQPNFDNPNSVETVAGLLLPGDAELEIYIVPLLMATNSSTGTIGLDDLYYDTNDNKVYKITASNDYSARVEVTDSLEIIRLSDYGTVYHDIALYQACEALKQLTFDKFFAKTCEEKEDIFKAEELLEEQINNASLAHLAKMYDTAVSIIDHINGIVQINCC
jgi:hypothetical protein